MDTQTRCTMAQSIIGYDFEDAKLLREALTAAGNYGMYANGRMHSQGNAALAFIGDAILKLKIGKTDLILPGETSNTLTNKACNKTLAGKCESSGLDICVLPAPGDRILSPSTKATAIEAVIGAVFMDSGHDYEAASLVMATLGVIKAVYR